MNGPEGLNFDDVSIERQKHHFIYTNTDISDHPEIFDCFAVDLAEADSLYEKKIGIKPGRNGSIGVSIL